jgi:hypothetical protein
VKTKNLNQSFLLKKIPKFSKNSQNSAARIIKKASRCVKFQAKINIRTQGICSRGSLGQTKLEG